MLVCHLCLPSDEMSVDVLSAFSTWILCCFTVSFDSFYAFEQFYEDLQDLLELAPQKDILFIIGDWNAKVGSQETPRVTDKFGLGVQNEAGQRLIEFCQEKALVIANTLFQQHNTTREDSTHGHHQMVNTKIRLIIYFVAKDGGALYSQ